jgi:hypothetical protein
MAISGELRFIADCCRFSFARGNGAPVQAGQLDWTLVLRLARFHRVQGAVAFALATISDRVPEEVANEIASDSRLIAANALSSTAESKKLLADFASAGVLLLFLKGLTLGGLAYRNPSLKASIDVDLLIGEADLDEASRLLRSNGYELEIPKAADRGSLRRWHRGSKESVWSKAAPSLQIDLHTRAADNRRVIPGIGVSSPQQSVDVGSGIQLPTLADEQLFAYLAVHGASSAWFRLKWIADLAGFLSGRTGGDLAHLYRRSQELGAGRAAGQALLLADALFDTLSDAPELAQELARDAGVQRLYRAALRLVSGEAREPTERPFGTMTIHWTQFLLLPGFAYKFSELTRQAGRAGARFA